MSVLGTTKRIVLATAALLAPALALAQPPGPPDDGPPPPRRRHSAPSEGNGDDQPRRPGHRSWPRSTPIATASLSPEEIQNAVAAFKKLDRNHDGTLDRSELEPRGANMGGPDGPPGGQPRGGRFGGPPPIGPDGPPPDGPPRGAGPARPAIGRVLPPFVREELSLSDRQQKQIADIASSVKSKLESILTPRQLRQLRERIATGPGGPGFGGPGGRGRAEPPGAGAPDDDNDPPVRPRRP